MVEGGYPVIVEHSLGCLMKAAGVQGKTKAYNLEKKAQLSQFLGVDFGEVTASISCLYNDSG